jgi:hypothetical protein
MHLKCDNYRENFSDCSHGVALLSIANTAWVLHHRLEENRTQIGMNMSHWGERMSQKANYFQQDLENELSGKQKTLRFRAVFIAIL